jgi:hypothetical protein
MADNDKDLSSVQDNELNVLGISKILRRNLVIGIMAIQFIAICSLAKYTVTLNQRITDIKTEQVDSANAMYNRLVQQIATKMQPLQSQVKELQNNVEVNDSLQTAIDKKKHK